MQQPASPKTFRDRTQSLYGKQKYIRSLNLEARLFAKLGGQVRSATGVPTITPPDTAAEGTRTPRFPKATAFARSSKNEPDGSIDLRVRRVPIIDQAAASSLSPSKPQKMLLHPLR